MIVIVRDSYCFQFMDGKMLLEKSEMCALVPDIIMQKHDNLPNSTLKD